MAKDKDFQWTGTMPFERYVFEKERLGIDFRLTKREMERMKGWDINRFEDDMVHSVVWRVSTMMAHGDRTVTATEDVPISWWDHLKLDVNLWARKYLLQPHFFFTNIAKAIAHLPITPKFRKIEKSILVKNFCPHIGVGDHKPHLEFMLQKPFNYLKGGDVDDRNPYGGTGY